MPPPPPPAGTDPRQLRSWCEKTWLSLRSCADALRNLQVEPRRSITPRDALGGGAGLDVSLFRFGYSIAGTTLTVNAGAIHPNDGRAAATVAGDTFALAGTKYTYATWDRVASTGTLYASAALPSSTIGLLVCPLHKFVGTDCTLIYHVGDVYLDTPIR